MAATAREIHFITHSGTGHGSQYARHRPERTLLYHLVEQHYPAFFEQLARRGQTLPGYVRREFEAYLRSKKKLRVRN